MREGADEVKVFILLIPSLLSCLRLPHPSTFDLGTPQNSGQLDATVFQGPGKGSRQTVLGFSLSYAEELGLIAVTQDSRCFSLTLLMV